MTNWLFLACFLGIGLQASSLQAADVPKMSYQLDDAFSPEQKVLLRRAVESVNVRFAEAAVWANTMRNERKFLLKEDAILDASIARNSGRNLLYYQLTYLKAYGYPKLNVHAFSKAEDTLGFAYTADKVILKFKTEDVKNFGKDTAEVSGEFKIHLNRYHIGRAGDYSAHEFWAGVIAHEMLHNLGHSHPKDDYDEFLQIMSFQNAIRTNGTYKSGAKAPRFVCGQPKQ